MRLATEFANVGHDILIANSRGPESLRAKLKENAAHSNIMPASMTEVKDCEFVVLAMPWANREMVLDPTHQWNGRILLDTTNIYLSYPPNYRVDDLRGDSGSEIIARLAPTARVVKAFNTLDFGVMFSPVPRGMKRVLFAAGDDKHALTTVCELIEELGFRSVRIGGLSEGGRLMDLQKPISLLNVLSPTERA
jgi:predicted dinucleotide-binding enzyme